MSAWSALARGLLLLLLGQSSARSARHLPLHPHLRLAPLLDPQPRLLSGSDRLALDRHPASNLLRLLLRLLQVADPHGSRARCPV